PDEQPAPGRPWGRGLALSGLLLHLPGSAGRLLDGPCRRHRQPPFAVLALAGRTLVLAAYPDVVEGPSPVAVGLAAPHHPRPAHAGSQEVGIRVLRWAARGRLVPVPPAERIKTVGTRPFGAFLQQAPEREFRRLVFVPLALRLLATGLL